MPTVTPAVATVNIRGMSVPRLTWTGIITGDTIEPYGITAQAAVAGSVQIGGTLGGATIALQGSNDGVTYFTLEDLTGTVISTASANLYEFTTSVLYLRPLVTGGAANSINVTVMLRG